MLLSARLRPLFAATASVSAPVQSRPFFGWLNAVFNRVDPARIAEVGPDRAAAEWLLRCGAAVTWKGAPRPLKDYNALPVGDFKKNRVAEIDATDSAIMEAGFPHLQGLVELRKMKIKNCRYVEDDSLKVLSSVTKTFLEELELSDLKSVTDDGVSSLGRISALKHLKLSNLPGVYDEKAVLQKLRDRLPNCNIEWPPFTDEDDSDKNKKDE